MTGDELFAEYEDEVSPKTTEETKSEIEKPEEIKVEVPTGNPYESLDDDQTIIIKDMADFYGLDVTEVISEFNKAYLDKSLNRFNSNKPKKFNLAKAIMKNVLDEKAKVKTFTVQPFGKNVFYAINSNQVISTVVALMQYEKDGKIIKKKKVIRSFDKVGDKCYQSLDKMIAFYNYEPMLKKDKKDEFQLSEFTSFEHGTPPEGKMANLTDLEIYAGLGIKPVESIKKAGLSRINKGEKYADPLDLKAIYVLSVSSKINKFNPPKDFPDVQSLSSTMMDEEGNSFLMYFPALPEFETMVNDFTPDEKFSGIAIGTLSEKEETGEITMNVFNFFPSDEGEE